MSVNLVDRRLLTDYYRFIGDISYDKVSGLPLFVYNCEFLGIEVMGLSDEERFKASRCAVVGLRHVGDWVGFDVVSLWDRWDFESIEQHEMFNSWLSCVLDDSLGFLRRDLRKFWEDRYISVVPSFRDFVDIKEKFYWDLRYRMYVRYQGSRRREVIERNIDDGKLAFSGAFKNIGVEIMEADVKEFIADGRLSLDGAVKMAKMLKDIVVDDGVKDSGGRLHFTNNINLGNGIGFDKDLESLVSDDTDLLLEASKVQQVKDKKDG